MYDKFTTIVAYFRFRKLYSINARWLQILQLRVPQTPPLKLNIAPFTTFGQSVSLHRSVFHEKPWQGDYKHPDCYGGRDTLAHFHSLEIWKRNFSMDFKPMSKIVPSLSRGTSNLELPTIGQNQQGRTSSNSENQPYCKAGFERFRVYEQQQQPYNILSFCLKDSKNNRLRNYLKLTLEDKLIERDAYHNFDK